jgi:hypothetical protein
MTRADSVHSTPPTNTSALPVDPTRRRFINIAAGASIVSVGSLVAAAAAQVIDTELIELGAKYEPLVDQYYAARKRWARSLMSAHAEHDREFGSREERGYQYSPEIAAAFQASCARSGTDEAADKLSAVHQQMFHLAKAINAAPVNSIEGLRAKALVALFEVSFDDAYPFQRLFTVVAELCGLKGKIAATGYELPDIAMVDDFDDDSDDEGEES